LGDTLAVTKLDRLARSVPDARAIADELTAREVKLNIGGSVYDSTDPIGRLLFTTLHGGRVRGRPRPHEDQGRYGRREGQWPAAGEEAQLAELFNVARSTVYRAIHRDGTE